MLAMQKFILLLLIIVGINAAEYAEIPYRGLYHAYAIANICNQELIVSVDGKCDNDAVKYDIIDHNNIVFSGELKNNGALNLPLNSRWYENKCIIRFNQAKGSMGISNKFIISFKKYGNVQGTIKLGLILYNIISFGYVMKYK
jgi:hypothetical protein